MRKEASIVSQCPVISYLCFQKLSKKCTISFCSSPPDFFSQLSVWGNKASIN